MAQLIDEKEVEKICCPHATELNRKKNHYEVSRQTMEKKQRHKLSAEMAM